MEIHSDVPLAPSTTFKVGGKARFFTTCTSRGELEEALAWAAQKNLPLYILGGGSNVLVRDQGFEGLVIQMKLQGVTEEESEDGVLFTVAAGESWDSFVERCVTRGLWGVENLSGIPGSVGAAPIQNIGAYGSELAHSVVHVEVLDRTTGAVTIFSNEECEFGYRTSIFKKIPERHVVLSVTCRLERMGAPNLSYKDLSEAFVGNVSPELSAVRAQVLSIRARKFPDIAQEGTAGSFFLNPILPAEEFELLQKRFPGVLHFPAAQGIKISLAWLLDKGLGITRRSVGGARQFERQPIVLVASRGADARDVEVLAEKIIAEVKKETTIVLEREVRVL